MLAPAVEPVPTPGGRTTGSGCCGRAARRKSGKKLPPVGNPSPLTPLSLATSVAGAGGLCERKSSKKNPGREEGWMASAAAAAADSAHASAQPWVMTGLPARGIDDELTIGAAIAADSATGVPGKWGQIYFRGENKSDPIF
jgi:hypothetical protein